MSDERGGRYFREARFFFAGNKAAAQSHTLEARSLMGHLRDLHALGGPPIQVQYATLKDGTRIKATMMNGQFQAEIVSPFGGVRSGKGYVPTLAGHQDIRIPGSFGATTLVGTHPFKWQKETGLTYLGKLPTHDIYYVTKVSDDGAVCAGYARVNGGVIVDGTVAHSWIVWDSDGNPSLAGTYSPFEAIDVRYSSPVVFPIPTAYHAVSGRTMSQRISDDDILFLGVNADPGNILCGAVTRVTRGPSGYTDSVLIRDVVGMGDAYSASQDGDEMFYRVTRTIVHPAGGEYLMGSARRATFNAFTGAYDYSLSAAIHPVLENLGGNSEIFCDATGDIVVAGEAEVYDFSVLSTSVVPVVYTQSTGELVRLEQHTGPTGMVSQRSLIPRAMCSNGSLVAGVYFDQTDNYAVAWQRLAGGVWSRIPALGGSFRGECTAAN